MNMEPVRIGRKYKQEDGRKMRAVPVGPTGLCYGCHYYDSQEFLNGCAIANGLPSCHDAEAKHIVIYKVAK